MDSLICLHTVEPLNIEGAHGEVGDEEEEETRAVTNNGAAHSNRFIPGQEPTDTEEKIIMERSSLVIVHVKYPGINEYRTS